MMYYLPYLFLLCMARDLGYIFRRWYLYSYAYMVLDFDICDAFEPFDLPLMQRLARNHRYVL